MRGETRDALDFPRLAQKQFDFLTKPPFSMALVRQEPLALRYEGNGVAVDVFHDRLSYDLGVSLRRTADENERNRPYMISDLIRVTDPVAAKRYRRFAATNREGLQHGLEKLAEELRTYGTPALKNDSDFNRRLSSARAGAASEFGREMAARSARAAGDKAWRARNWYKVAEAYGSIDSDLSPGERERLAYARRQLAKRG